MRSYLCAISVEFQYGKVYYTPRKTVQVVTVLEVSLVGYEGGFKNPNVEVVSVRKSFSSEAVS